MMKSNKPNCVRN